MPQNTIYYGKMNAVAWVATDSQSGYPPSNVSKESLSRPWRAVDAGAKTFVTTFPAAANCAALILNGVNFASCDVYKSADGINFVLVGTLTTFADKQIGRRRGYIDINDANVLALRLNIAAGVPTDGAASWCIGASYPFGSFTTLSRMPQIQAKVDALYPIIRTELPNKRVSAASTGPSLLTLTLPYQRRNDQDIHEIVRRARLGTIGFALVPTGYDEFVLPVYFSEESNTETFTNLMRTDGDILLREVV